MFSFSVKLASRLRIVIDKRFKHHYGDGGGGGGGTWGGNPGEKGAGSLREVR